MDSSLEPEIVDRLVDLDVPPLCAKTYVRLLMSGPGTASDLAQAMDVRREEAYHCLDILTGKGFVAATLTRPMMYVPTDLKQVLRILYKQRVRRAQAVRRAERDLDPLLRRLHSVAEISHGMPFRIINGRDRAYENLHDMLDGAMREMLVLNSHPSAGHLAAQAGLWRRVQQRAEIGLQLRILLGNSPTTRRHASQVSSPNCQVRLMDLDDMMRFSIVDETRMLFFASMDASPWMAANDCAVMTEVAGFVDAQKQLFYYLWDEAMPIKALNT